MNTLIYSVFADELEQIKLAQLKKQALPFGNLWSALSGGRQAAQKLWTGRAVTIAAPAPRALAAPTSQLVNPAGATMAATKRGRLMPAKPTMPVQQLTPMQQQAERWGNIFKSPAMQEERAAADKWFQGRMAAQQAAPAPTPVLASQRSWKKQTLRPETMTPAQLGEIQRFRAGVRPLSMLLKTPQRAGLM